MDIHRYAVEVSPDFLYPTGHYSSASSLEFFMEELNVTRLVVLSAAAAFESVILWFLSICSLNSLLELKNSPHELHLEILGVILPHYLTFFLVKQRSLKPK
jgi:hypothetical protein